MKYVVCCKNNEHEQGTFDTEKEAQDKAKRYSIQRLTCEQCGSRDWIVVERED